MSNNKDTFSIKEMEPLFNPSSIAVIGASPNEQTPHGRALRMVIDNGFQGEVYAVNPNYSDIGGVPCYSRVKEIPGEVELAVVAVTADKVPQVLRECAEKGVKGAVILSSGFGEAQEEGGTTEEEMARLARENGMRLVGPNCVGLINNFDGVWATFAEQLTTMESHYPLAYDLISQSGFFGIAIYHIMLEYGIGFARYASIGNQADLTFSDFLAYFVNDTRTRVVGGYIEGLKDGERFLEAARGALENDTILLAMKVGRTGVGAQAALSHTGTMAGSDRLYQALFRQTGVIRVNDLEEMIAFLLISLPGRWPRGKRVAVVSASGGGAVILSDKCAMYGLEVVDFDPETRRALDERLPYFASSRNPVDITSQIMMEPHLLQECLEKVISDPNVDAIMLSFHLNYQHLHSMLDNIKEIYWKFDKPIYFIGKPFGSGEDVKELEKEIHQIGIPLVSNIDYGVWAISQLVHWQEKSRNYRQSRVYLMDEEKRSASAALIEEYRRDGETLLTEHKAARLLESAGVPCARGELAETPEEALDAAGRLGYPLALKVQSPDLLHKSEAGAVRLNMSGEAELEEAFREMEKVMEGLKKSGGHEGNAPPSLEGILVQEMLPAGQEVIIGVKREPGLGPAVMFGLGGVLTEVLEDVTFKMAPLTEKDAREMLDEIKGGRLLDGYRGMPAVDREMLVEVLLKVSALAYHNPSIREIDINPFMALPKGQAGRAADAVVILD